MVNFEEIKGVLSSLRDMDKAWKYIEWSFRSRDFYTPDELINMSLEGNFILDTPFVRIRRGTRILSGTQISSESYVSGANVTLGQDTVLDNARITGSNIFAGTNNTFSGDFTLSNCRIGNNNNINNIKGASEHSGLINIGNNNKLQGVNFTNTGGVDIHIGNDNEMFPNLSINGIFPYGWIKIGNGNSLGRDGGGVISNSYRFNRQMWGCVLVGSNVETARGAEILGFSILGYNESDLSPLTTKKDVYNLLAHSKIPELLKLFENLRELTVPSIVSEKQVSIFGVAKIRRSCLLPTTKVFDGAQIVTSVTKNVFVYENCKILNSLINRDKLTSIQSNKVAEGIIVEEDYDLKALPITADAFGFPYTDEADWQYMTANNQLYSRTD